MHLKLFDYRGIRCSSAGLQPRSFVWRSLADPLPGVKLHQFTAALSGLNRQTEPYRSALLLAQVLLLGVDPPGAYEVGSLLAPLPRFDLAQLFERVTARLVRTAAASVHLETRTQHNRGDVLVDAEGDTYRRVRPDLVLFRAGVPVGVLDAKYRSRYTTYREGDYRVAPADIYQMFFYSERIARLYHLPSAIPGFILAPTLSPDHLDVPENRRTIFWESLAARTLGTSLRVLAIDVHSVADAVLRGEDPIRCCPDLIRAISTL